MTDRKPTFTEIDDLAARLFARVENGDNDVWRVLDEGHRNFWRRVARVAIELVRQ